MTRTTAAAASNDGGVLADDGTGGVTRYRQLASVIRHKIISGEYPVGMQLPTLDCLAQTYGIAKVTVRQAIAVLTDEGLVSSQRGRGTHVIKQPPAPGEGLRAAINDESAHGSELEIRILQRRHGVALRPGLARRGTPLDSYVMVRKLHLHGGTPFCLIEMYVASSVFARFPRGGEKHHKLVHLLRQVEGDRLGTMQQSMTVEPADYILAHDLAYGFGAPIARIVRSTLDVDGNVLLAGLFWYRGDRFILDVEMPAKLIEHYPALAIPDSRR